VADREGGNQRSIAKRKNAAFAKRKTQPGEKGLKTVSLEGKKKNHGQPKKGNSRRGGGERHYTSFWSDTRNLHKKGVGEVSEETR